MYYKYFSLNNHNLEIYTYNITLYHLFNFFYKVYFFILIYFNNDCMIDLSE